MEKYRLYFKDIDPDTGEISQIKDIATIKGTRNSLEWIKAALYSYDDNPNRDYYYEEIVKDKSSLPKIELLNSEGPILVAQKTGENEYEIIDRNKNICAVLTKKEIQIFVHKDLVIGDTLGDYWKYSEQPGSMKPNLKELDEFIGIDTTGKSY